MTLSATSSPLKIGFTLIELSIVLVIIGLVVGGILTGRDLIRAAELSATISQIQKYNTAARTFQLKYGYLPGDIPNPTASNFGFQARGTLGGEGDGNGLLESYGNSTTCGFYQGLGETAMFWVDLSKAGLIDSSFNTASASAYPPAGVYSYTTPSLSAYFPQAKLGNGNYIYIWSGGYQNIGYPCGASDGNNYFGLSTIGWIDTGGEMNGANTAMTVNQAYNIDKKIDDGLPQSGTVIAIYLNWQTSLPGSVAWAAGSGNFGASTGGGAPTTAATPYAATNCYDNNNTNNTTQTYSLKQNANQQNCALSFRFQ